MDKATTIAIRDKLKSIKFPMWNRKTGEKKEFSPYLHVCCDNSLNVIDDGHSIIWDDDNEIFYWIKANTVGSMPYATNLSVGDAVHLPYLVIGVDYGEIQNIRAQMTKEMMDAFLETFGSKVTTEFKQELVDEIMSQSDMRNVFVAKRDRNYNTGLPKKYDPDHKNGDPSYVHGKTVHISANGGV